MESKIGKYRGPDEEYCLRLGLRIQSELNDIKRTPDACARELKWDVSVIEDVLAGRASRELASELKDLLLTQYPISPRDLAVEISQETSGITISRMRENTAGARIFDREDPQLGKAPYYEYRDTAMTPLSPFRPEWIRPLRVVTDNDAENELAVLNYGHFLHQITFFAGPVNFYHKKGDRTVCTPLNFGDTNYIPPFIPHSFTSRDSENDGLIVAVTFGGVAKAALDELSLLDEMQLRRAIQTFTPQQSGEDKHQVIDGTFTSCDLVSEESEAPKGAGSEPLQGSEPAFVRYSRDRSFSVNITRKNSPYLVKGASSLSNIGANSYIYFAPAAKECRDEGPLPGLETYKGVYLFNPSSQRAQLTWQRSGRTFTESLEPNDSAYIEPMTPFNLIGEDEQLELFLVAVPTRLTSATLLELSEFDRLDRVIAETTPWFKI
jgi:hypothetical protein